jgi:hypothetical protein
VALIAHQLGVLALGVLVLRVMVLRVLALGVLILGVLALREKRVQQLPALCGTNTFATPKSQRYAVKATAGSVMNVSKV